MFPLSSLVVCIYLFLQTTAAPWHAILLLYSQYSCSKQSCNPHKTIYRTCMPLHFSEIFVFLYKNFPQIIIIIINIIIIIAFIQSICNYAPEKTRVSSAAVILWLQCKVHVILFSMLNILYFPNYVWLPNLAVICSSLLSWFPGMLFKYCLNDLEIVPVTHIFTDITFVFIFYTHCISVARYSYFRIFSAPSLVTFLSPEFAAFINAHVPYLLSRIIMSGLLSGKVSVGWQLLIPKYGNLTFMTCRDWFGNDHITVHCLIVPPFLCICHKCSCAHILSCLFMYCSYVCIGYAEFMLSRHILAYYCYYNYIYIFFFCGAATQRGSWPPHSWGF
jgi:hypothetical protein